MDRSFAAFAVVVDGVPLNGDGAIAPLRAAGRRLGDNALIR